MCSYIPPIHIVIVIVKITLFWNTYKDNSITCITLKQAFERSTEVHRYPRKMNPNTHIN